MRILRTNTATRITAGPFFGTDGLTPSTALTVTSEKLTMTVDTAGVPTLVLDTAPTASGGANDMVHITGDDAGYYDLELAAADVNYLGRAHLALTNAAAHVPVFHEFMIEDAFSYDMRFVANRALHSFGITVAAGVMGSAGHTTTAGSFAGGDGAKAKVGYLIWVPATYDMHRIKTLATDAWTVDAGDAFSTDPNGATYYILANPLNLPLTSSDIATSFGQALADRLLARNQLGGADSSPTVAMAIASGLLKIEISGGTLTVKHGDGSVAYTRTITRQEADSILSLV